MGEDAFKSKGLDLPLFPFNLTFNIQKKMNLKNLKHFKKGMKELTPIQIGEGKLIGYYGMVVGLSLACITMFRNRSWGLGIFLIFLVWFQIMGLISEKQSLKGLKDMEALQNE